MPEAATRDCHFTFIYAPSKQENGHTCVSSVSENFRKYPPPPPHPACVASLGEVHDWWYLFYGIYFLSVWVYRYPFLTCNFCFSSNGMKDFDQFI